MIFLVVLKVLSDTFVSRCNTCEHSTSLLDLGFPSYLKHTDVRLWQHTPNIPRHISLAQCHTETGDLRVALLQTAQNEVDFGGILLGLYLFLPLKPVAQLFAPTRALAYHIGSHDLLQGHLQLYVIEQVLIHRGLGCVRLGGDETNRRQYVLLFSVGA